MNKCLFLLAVLPGMALAQNNITSNPKLQRSEDFRFCKHMEVGATAGLTGFGLEMATPLNRHLNLRAGFAWMPGFSSVASYGLSTSNGSTEQISKVCQSLSKLLGTTIDEYVDMNRQIGYCNGKLLLDWYPFHKKHWHFTGGLYIGSRNIGQMYNLQAESPTMLAVNMYNSLYDQFKTLPEGEYPTITIGEYSFELDPATGEMIKSHGSLGIKAGDRVGTSGESVMLAPDENGIMKADANVNLVKPYVGFGYSTQFGYDRRWSFSADAGVLIWGKPTVIYYQKNGEVTNLTTEVENSTGVIGSYLNLVKHLPVLPVIELRLAYTIF